MENADFERLVTESWQRLCHHANRTSNIDRSLGESDIRQELRVVLWTLWVRHGGLPFDELRRMAERAMRVRCDELLRQNEPRRLVRHVPIEAELDR